MTPELELIGGYEDIGIRFSMRDGSVWIEVPESITLTESEIQQLKAMKADILLAIEKGEVLP